MTKRQFISTFEDRYRVYITASGRKRVARLYREFEEHVVTDALFIAMEKYNDPIDSLDKIGGICYNMSKDWVTQIRQEWGE